MFNRFSEWSVSKKNGLAIAGMLVLFSTVAIIFVLSKRTDPTHSQTPPIKFKYCEVNPKDLCILSFGRGGTDSSIINFFVPNLEFPYFYLTIKKAEGESRYDCIQNSEIRTSVLCIGDPLSLKQTIEINLLASEDDHLLATGTFFIEAFLVSTLDAQSADTANSETQSPLTNQVTEIPALESSITEVTATEIPTTAYSDPSYPYP